MSHSEELPRLIASHAPGLVRTAAQIRAVPLPPVSPPPQVTRTASISTADAEPSAVRRVAVRTGIDGTAQFLNGRGHDLVVDPQARQEPAHRLANWLQSPQGQAAIGAYTINGQKLFHPEADPKP